MGISPTLKAQELPEHKTVYATRTDDAIEETPASVTILEKAEIEKYDAPGQNLGTLLGKAVPGFGMPTESVSNFGQTLQGRDVLILIDGIPQNENRQVSRQLNNIKVETIERIEVVSGANAIYGAGAPGGIINIITKGYSSDPATSESWLGTSFNTKPLARSSQTYNLQQSVSGTLGSFQYLASVGGEWRKNSFDAEGHQIPPEPAQTSRNDTDTYDALLKARYNLTPHSFTEASFEYFTEEQDSDYAVVLNPYRAESGLQLDQQPSSKRKQISLRYEDSEFLGQKLSLLGYYRDRELTFFPFALTVPAPIVNQSTSKAEVSGLKAVVQTSLPMRTELAWGLDLELNKGKERAHSYDQLRYEISNGKIYTGKSADYDYGPVIDTKTAALFAQMKTSWTDQLHSKLGLRYERINQDVHDFTPPLETAIAKNWPIIYAGIAQMEGLGRVPAGTTASLPQNFVPKNFKGGDLDYDAWAANLGFTYDITPRQQAFVNFSQGYELGDTARLLRDAVSPNSLVPTISPIFGLAIDSTTVSSLDLAAIKTTSYETGWRGSIDRFFGGATLFYNQSDKVYQFNSDFTVDLLNLKKRIYGLEIDTGVRPTDALTLTLSHARAKGEARRANGPGWAALSGLEVSPPKTTATADYVFNEHARVNLIGTHVAPYNREDDLTPNDKKGALDLGEYFVMDGGFIYAWSDKASLKTQITNLLNRRYKTLFHQWAEYTYGEASGAPAEGRRIALVFDYVY